MIPNLQPFSKCLLILPFRNDKDNIVCLLHLCYLILLFASSRTKNSIKCLPDKNNHIELLKTLILYLDLYLQPCWLVKTVKKLPAIRGEPGSISGLGRSPGEGNGYPVQYSCLGNSMACGAWWAAVHGVTKSWTELSDCHFHVLHSQQTSQSQSREY